MQFEQVYSLRNITALLNHRPEGSSWNHGAMKAVGGQKHCLLSRLSRVHHARGSAPPGGGYLSKWYCAEAAVRRVLLPACKLKGRLLLLDSGASARASRTPLWSGWVRRGFSLSSILARCAPSCKGLRGRDKGKFCAFVRGVMWTHKQRVRLRFTAPHCSAAFGFQ